MIDRAPVSVLLLFMLLFAAKSSATVREEKAVDDSMRKITIYYRSDSSCIDLSSLGNDVSMARLEAALSVGIGCCDSLTVSAFASPFECGGSNKQLMDERAQQVMTYLKQQFPSLKVGITPMRTSCEQWSELREQIVRDSEMPNREEALILIDYHRKVPTMKRSLLRRLNGRKAYRYLGSHLLPMMQRVEIRVGCQTAWQRVEPLSKELPCFASVVTPLVVKTIEPLPTVCPAKRERRTVIALKNNILYDLALTPNVEIEFPMSRAWSVNVEYQFPWWLNNERDFCFQLQSGGIELRHWLGNRRKRSRLTGHFVGLYGSGGQYDFQFGGEGCQGESFLTSGLTYGYGKSITSRLSLELSLGMGYLVTDYLKYTPYKGSLVWHSDGQHRYFGLTKAKVSLVWHITTKR